MQHTYIGLRMHILYKHTHAYYVPTLTLTLNRSNLLVGDLIALVKEAADGMEKTDQNKVPRPPSSQLLLLLSPKGAQIASQSSSLSHL